VSFCAKIRPAQKVPSLNAYLCKAKSRRRKQKPQNSLPRGVFPMTPRVYEALLEQRKAFIETFGREPGPTDPVFFDPDKEVPTPIDPARMDADLEKVMRDAGIDTAKADAIRKLLR
jgi:hypothetical protein